MMKRMTLLALMLSALTAQVGCGYLAAGAAGAVVGEEAAEDDE
jgi:hypothetical protein